MKVMARVNRGAILTAVVLIAVIVYLFVLSTVRSTEKPAFIDLCADYIQTELKYTMLPERYRSDQQGLSAEVRAQYLSEMESALSGFYIKDEQIRKFNLNNQRSRLEPQMRGVDVIFDYQKSIQKYQSFVYDNDILTVTVRCNTVYEGTITRDMPVGRKKVIEETTDTVVLKKEAGKWRIVYAVLIIPGNEYGWYPGMSVNPETIYK